MSAAVASGDPLWFDHGGWPGSSTDDVVSLLAARDAENAALRGEIAAVRNENAALLARVSKLEGLVAALHAQRGRDSANSGKPPSSDSPFTKKPAAKRSVRTRSGKPRGKQPGAPSATLGLIDDPDDTVPLVKTGTRGRHD